MKYALLAAAMVAMAGCATRQTAGGAQVRDADERMVANCEFVGEVAASSGWGGLAANTGLESARNQSRNQAARLGGTHILWATLNMGGLPSASGRAYRCQ